MNKLRREKLAKLSGEASTLSASIQELLDEEQEYFDNMPESIQGGEKGNVAQAAIDSMQSAINALDSEVFSSLDEAQD